MNHRRAWLIAEVLFSYLNFHFILSPKREEEFERHLGKWRMTGEQRVKWECLRLDLAAACRLGRKPCESPSRGAARVG